MVSADADQRQQWSSWTRLLIDRVPLPFPATVALVTGILLAEQALEQSYNNLGSVGLLSTYALSSRLALPLVFIYAVTMVKVLRSTALRELADLRPALKLSDAQYDGFVRRMVSTSVSTEVAMGVVSLGIVLLLLVVLDQPLPIGNDMYKMYLPPSPLADLFIVVSYVLFGWGGLTLVVATVQLGLSLGALARSPLIVNVFDAENLLPFGRLSLLHSVSEAGMILILLIALGQPHSTLAWGVVLMGTVTSLLALLMPLWGVHRQMSQAKTQALGQIHRQFMECQTALFHSSDLPEARLTELCARIDKLAQLRKTVHGASNWPFRDVGAGARAVVTAMSPLVYVVATEAIRSYLKNFIR